MEKKKKTPRMHDYVVVVQVTPDKFRFSDNGHGEVINLAYIYIAVIVVD